MSQADWATIGYPKCSYIFCPICLPKPKVMTTEKQCIGLIKPQLSAFINRILRVDCRLASSKPKQKSNVMENLEYFMIELE